jgi:hypothetical protein
VTHRQWLIIQQAMLTFERALVEGDFCWNDADDGPPPTQEEVSETMGELCEIVTVLAPED